MVLLAFDFHLTFKLAKIFIADIALFRILCDHPTVEQYADQSDGKENQETDKTVFYTGKDRKSNDVLGNTCGVHVEHATGKSGAGSHHDCCDCRQSVVSDCHNGCGCNTEERIRSFAESQDTHNGKSDVEQDNYAQLYPFVVGAGLKDFRNSCAERTGIFNNSDHSAGNEEGSDNGRAFHKSVIDGSEEIEQRNIIGLFNEIELIRIDDLVSLRVCASYELATRNNIGKYGYEQHDDHQYEQYMRHFEMFLFLDHDLSSPFHVMLKTNIATIMPIAKVMCFDGDAGDQEPD